MRRPAVLLAWAFGAGLGTGLLRLGPPTLVELGLGVLAVSGWRRAPGWVVGVALLGRVLGGFILAAEAETCAARLPVGRLAIRVRVADPVGEAGGPTKLAPTRAGCRGWVAARWPPGHPVRAGHLAHVIARWQPREPRWGRPRGTLRVLDVRSIRSDTRPNEVLKNRLVASIDRLYGERAPIVDALVLNQKADLAPEVRQRYARSGMIHLLAISGFHVGLVSAWLFALARLLRLSRRSAFAVASLGALAYAAFLGWPAPATRAALLGTLIALARIRQRVVDPGSLLGATAVLVLIIDPWAILSPGAWLSLGAVWGIGSFAWRTRRIRWRGRVRRAISASMGATLGTAPLTAALFGVVAPAGVGLNLVALPLAGVAVPGVLASLALEPLAPPLAARLATGAGLGLDLLDRVAQAGARIPLGHIVQPAAPSSAGPWVACLVVVWWITGGRNTAAEAGRRLAWVLVAIVWAPVALRLGPPLSHGDSRLALHFLDVGQGDAVVIRTPCGRWLVVDAGPRYDRFDAGAHRVIPFLIRQRVRGLSMVVASHAHADHLGGIPAVLEQFPTRLVVEPGVAVPDALYREFLSALEPEPDARARAGAAVWRAASAGQRLEVDGVRVSVLHPDSAWAQWGDDLNEDSVILLVEYGDFQALLSGDAGLPAETHLRGTVGPVDVLKVGHHGSKTATGPMWVQELQPKMAVISVGRNRYGHPDPTVVARLAGGASLWRTDREGDIRVLTDGRTMDVRSRTRRERFADLRARQEQLADGAGARGERAMTPHCSDEEWFP